MAEEYDPIDISKLPEVLQIVEKVRASRRPQVLVSGREDMAIVVPLLTKRRRIYQPAAHRDAVLNAAGSWKGLVDGQELKDRIAAERGSDRPSVSL